jgi:hypothetical protein
MMIVMALGPIFPMDSLVPSRPSSALNRFSRNIDSRDVGRRTLGAGGVDALHHVVVG